MIKVNLLEGAADTRAATRATKAAAKTTQQLLMVAGVLVMLLMALGADYYITQEKLRKAEADLAQQQSEAAQLKQNREQKEALEKQIKNVEDRIKIIDDLKKTQQGPSAMLSLIDSKMPRGGLGDLRLDRIAQSKDDLTIEGVAADPTVISEFSRGLELGSNGLFQSVGLDVSRQDEQQPDPNDPTVTRLVTTYKFKITTKYTPTLVGQPAAPAGGAPAAPAAGAPPVPAPVPAPAPR